MLGFKDMMVVDYAPGEPVEIKYRRKRRKVQDTEEALSIPQKMKLARRMSKLAPRLKIARKRAMMRMASKEKLKGRARKEARNFFFLKLSKGVPKDQLPYARRAEIEKRLDKPAMKQKIDKYAMRILPKVRKRDKEKLNRGGNK